MNWKDLFKQKIYQAPEDDFKAAGVIPTSVDNIIQTDCPMAELLIEHDKDETLDVYFVPVDRPVANVHHAVNHYVGTVLGPSARLFQLQVPPTPFSIMLMGEQGQWVSAKCTLEPTTYSAEVSGAAKEVPYLKVVKKPPFVVKT